MHRLRSVRLGLGAAAGISACAGAQALWLRSRYHANDPLPEARGPLRGVAAWARHQHQLSGRHAGGTAAAISSCGAAQSAPASATASAHEPAVGAAEHGPADAARDRPLGRRRNILVVGDSLVTGVGCSQDDTSGPALPRAVAEILAQQLRADVAWTAIGETGIDATDLRRELLPALVREVRGACASGQPFDVVVVICGLNDFKVRGPRQISADLGRSRPISNDLE